MAARKKRILANLFDIENPTFGFPLVKSILFSLPLSGQDQVNLFKTTLSGLSLDQQVSALQTLRYSGKFSLANQIAKGLFGRYLVSNLESKSADEIWENSAKIVECRCLCTRTGGIGTNGWRKRTAENSIEER
jgi:hypothetical protein